MASFAQINKSSNLVDTKHFHQVFSFFFFLLHWIKKRSSHGCLLEHLDSSGLNYDEKTYCMKVMHWKEKSNKQRSVMFFSISQFTFFLRCWFTTIAWDLRHILSLFGVGGKVAGLQLGSYVSFS